ncbi:hypothetical protein [Elizabethkingia anophelis]|uniref:hypothetical protein n=1 Tax=Elizabethkingia anophelis TaxID=1117645 RepID=UPI0011312E65|nr:hypothetical protein [Elizabethkingia anophelis]
MKKLKLLTRNDIKSIKAGDFRFPDKSGNCLRGWYLCPTGVCVDDNGGRNPITPVNRYYKVCFNQ